MSVLTGTPSHFRLFGRPVIPLLLSLSMVTFAFFWYQTIADDSVLSDHLLADFTGFLSGAAAAFLAFSWWFQSQRLLLVGLALAVGVMVSRAVLLVLVGGVGTGFGAWSAASWAAAGALTFATEMRADYVHSARSPFRLRGRSG